MKCPDCGFECLPDDVECLACGTHIAAAAKNKKLEERRSLEAVARQAEYDHAFRKELGLINEDEEFEPKKVVNKNNTPTVKTPPDKQTDRQKIISEPSVTVSICPKCGFEVNENDPDCMRCGIVFNKYNNNCTQSSQTLTPDNSLSQKIVSDPMLIPGNDLGLNVDDEIIEEIEKTTDSKIDDSGVDEIEISNLRMEHEEEKFQIDVEETASVQSQSVEIYEDDKTDEIDLSTLRVETEENIHEIVVVENQPENIVESEVEDLEPAEFISNPIEAVSEAEESIKNIGSNNEDETISEDLSECQSSTKSLSLETQMPEPEIVNGENTQIVKDSTGENTLKENGNLKNKGSAFLIFLKNLFEKTKITIAKWGKNIAGLSLRHKIIVSIALVLLVSISIFFGAGYYTDIKSTRAESKRLALIESIRLDFIKNKASIIKKIRTVIYNRQFDSAKKMITRYDIASLENEIAGVKNYLKEMQLYEKIKKVPATEFEKNYRLFVEILELNPANEKYQRKCAYYKQKYANNEYNKAAVYLKRKNADYNALILSIGLVSTSLELYPADKKYINLLKTLKTKKLLFPEGNNKITMAVQNSGMGKKLYSGQRKIMVWIKNISKEVVYLNVQYISMIGKNKKKYSYNDIGKKFKNRLNPGEQTFGELYFRTRTMPHKIVFSHLVCGEISREFP